MRKVSQCLIWVIDALEGFKSRIDKNFDIWFDRQDPGELLHRTCMAGLLACGVAVILILSTEPSRVVRPVQPKASQAVEMTESGR